MSHPPRSGDRLAVLFLDLDGLKAVNDTYGHAVGDRAIVETAERIVAQVRTDDIVARIGGDEFVVALPRVHSAADAEMVAEKIHRAVAHPIEIEDHRVRVSVSVALADPGAVTDLALEHADLALYRAKNSGRARTIVYDPDVDHARSTEDPPD